MSTESLDLSGLWLIPFILLATVAGLYLLVRHWQSRIRQEMKEMRSDLRRFQARRRQVAQAVQDHSADDPEPYGSRMARLQGTLQEIDLLSAGLERRHIAIQERMRYLSFRRWQAAMGAPFFWYRLWQETTDLKADIQRFHFDFTAVEQAGQGFASLGWEVAQQARILRDLHEQASHMLETFRARRACGDALDAAVRQEQAVRAVLASLPFVFYAGEQQDLFEHAEKDDITRVHNALEEVRPQVEDLNIHLQAWEKDYEQTVDQVRTMRQAYDALQSTLAGSPPVLNLSTIRTQAGLMEEVAGSLQATLQRLELESMGQVQREAARLREAAQQVEALLRQSFQGQAALETLLPELESSLKAASAQFAALGTASIHPVAWNESRSLLADLNRQAAGLGTARKERTPEQVEADLVLANQLKDRQKALAHHILQVARQHSELQALINGPELSSAPEWLQSARRLSERAAGYDPENWLRQDAVATLSTDLQAVSNRLQSLVIERAEEPLAEAELARRLEEIRRLAQEFQGMRQRVIKIQARLEEILTTEKTTADGLTRLQSALTQFDLLARSNPVLAEVASKGVGRFQASLQELSGSLAQTQRGTVEKKARGVENLLARVEQSGNAWLDALGKDSEAQRQELADQLTAMDGIAPLDEPPLAEARRLLSAGQAFSRLGAKARLRLDEITLELKRRSEHWESCRASLHAVQDISQPLLENYQVARQNRETAHQQLAELAGWLRSIHNWPPTSLNIEAERLELARVDELWAALKNQRARAINLVAQLSNLAAKYAVVADAARRTAERAEQQQAQFQDLESDLDDLAQRWQNQWQAYRENQPTSQQIQKLVNEIAGERDAIKKQYRAGVKDYNQVMQALTALRKRVRIHQVFIDEHHVIDINGRVIPFR